MVQSHPAQCCSRETASMRIDYKELFGKKKVQTNSSIEALNKDTSSLSTTVGVSEGQGVVELQDGHRLCLYGNVLYALGNHSSGMVTEVCIKYLGWATISGAVHKLAGLPRLKKLVFEVRHNQQY